MHAYLNILLSFNPMPIVIFKVGHNLAYTWLPFSLTIEISRSGKLPFLFWVKIRLTLLGSLTFHCFQWTPRNHKGGGKLSENLYLSHFLFPYVTTHWRTFYTIRVIGQYSCFGIIFNVQRPITLATGNTFL